MKKNKNKSLYVASSKHEFQVNAYFIPFNHLVKLQLTHPTSHPFKEYNSEFSRNINCIY